MNSWNLGATRTLVAAMIGLAAGITYFAACGGGDGDGGGGGTSISGSGVQQDTNTNRIRCDGGEGTVTLSGPVVIDGAGVDDCVETRGGCTLNLVVSGGDLMLQNCDRCLDSEQASTVAISVDGDFSCQAGEDGIRSQDTSRVDVSSGNLTIQAGENGIRARDTSSVALAATGTCTVSGAENAIRREPGATVDTSRCNQLVLQGGIRDD